MDSVNDTDGSGGCDDPPSGPTMSEGRRIKVCPLCVALNQSSSRDCSNCGWHSTFRGNEAGGFFAWLRLRSRVFLMYW